MATPKASAVRQMAAVGRKELHQILRDPRSLATLLFVPVFILLLYGYALNFDIRHVRLGVEDRDRSVESRRLVAAFTTSEYFDFAAEVTSARQLQALLNRNEVRAVLVIPERFSRAVRTGRPAEVQLVINGDNANTATAVMGYATAIVRGVAAHGGGDARITPSLLRVEPRVWFNPELRSTLFLVPGLIAFIVMLTAVISTSLSLVREKERGTMEQVRMAPLGALSFVLGKTTPYLGLALLSAMLIVVTSMTLFGLPMRGSWALLLLATVVFLVGALGFGLFISTIAQSQQVAFQMALLTSFLPTFVLSGFVFPIASMPLAIQLVTYLVPARYYLVALRSIVLKGVGLEAFAWELAALAVFAVLVLGLSARRLARQWS